MPERGVPGSPPDLPGWTAPSPTADWVGAAAALGPPRFGWRCGLAVYAAFAAGVVLVSWPLALRPDALWPPHHDARVFTWVMTSVARRLLTHPLSLFHGSAFYPFGESLAYSELLLLPTLLGLPGFLWGNPILTYNLLLLALWPLNGLAMTWVAHRLTRSWSGAWVAGAVFCLSPYFTEYYLEFQMLLAAAFPVVILAWMRWLETGRPRWLVLGLGGLVIQALTAWYYGILLALALVTLSIGFLCVRWQPWAWKRLLLGAVAAAIVGALLLPFALPYLAIRQEVGYERSLGETAEHYADLLTLVEPGRRSLLYGFAPARHQAETSTFPGFVVFALAAASLLWLRGDGRRPALPTRLGQALSLALAAALAGVAWAIRFPRGRYHLGPLVIRPRARELLWAVLVLGLLLLVIRAWGARRLGRPSRLTEGDWVGLLLLLAGVFAVLALGPVIHVARREVGPGPYGDLYPVLFPLHAVRVTVRFAVLTLAGVALLAALGLRAIEERLRGHAGVRRLVVCVVLLLLALEYAVTPAIYEPVRWAPRPIDEVLRADVDEVAVLEFPTNVYNTDADAMLQSLWHGKLVVNGLSGYVPPFIKELSGLLTTPGAPFPGPDAQAALRQIYPLRYLVVRLRDPGLPSEWVPEWVAAREKAPPLLRFRASLNGNDLYEIVPLPERGVRSERWVSYDVLRRRPMLHLKLRPLVRDAARDQWVEVGLNGHSIERVALNGEVAGRVALPPSSRRVAPNVIELHYRYRPSPSARDSRNLVGTTTVLSPCDLLVSSAGHPHGNVSSILVNGIELSSNRRGYNLVALDREGRIIETAIFDTHVGLRESDRLEAWVRSLSNGSIVAGAVRDEGSQHLTLGAVAALRLLGVVGDLRGHYRESHAFIGVKGARPGTAIEALGRRRVEVSVGRPRLDLGYELTDFALTPPAALL
jgi:hypothetical protein